MTSEVMKEFLVSVGWRSDQAAVTRIFDDVAKLDGLLIKLTAAAVAATAAITAAAIKTADAFEQLYYSSQRAGTSVNNLRALGFAASQFGSSADEAAAAVENLAKKFRDSPGYAQQLRGLGVDMSGDNVARLESFMDRLAKMPTAQRNAWLEAYGYSEKLFYAIENPQFRKAFDDYLKRQKQAGLDADQAAKGSTKFMQSLRELRSNIGTVWDRAASAIFEKYGDVFKQFGDYILAHSTQISDFIVRFAGAMLHLAEEVGALLPKLDSFVEKIGGWNTVLDALGVILLLKVIPGLGRLSTMLLGFAGMRLPIWLLGLLGLPAGAAGAALVGGAAAIGAGVGAYAAGGDDPADAGDGSLWGKFKGVGRRIGRGVKRLLGGGGDEGGTAGAVSGSMSARGLALMKRLVEVHGWTPEAAAIAAGNAQQESSIQPNGPAGDHGSAHGMFQWRNDRAAALRAYMAAHPGLSAFDAQVDFFNEERQHRSGLEASWHSMHDLSQAGAVGKVFEKYGDNSTGTRVANAHEWLRRWQSRDQVARSPSPWGGSAEAAEVHNPFGSLDTASLRNQFKTGGLGVSGTANSWKSTTINNSPTQNVQVHVEGAASPTDTAHAIAGNLKRSGADLIRNMTPQAQ